MNLLHPTVFKGTNTEWMQAPPTAGRVTCITPDTAGEPWRHERPKVAWVGGTAAEPLFEDVGDPVASGIAVANGCLYFTTFTSNRLVVLDAATGRSLTEIPLGPVLAGPSVSRGRVYIGTGNTEFLPDDSEAYFPKRETGVLHCFGLPDDDGLEGVVPEPVERR